LGIGTFLFKQKIKIEGDYVVARFDQPRRENKKKGEGIHQIIEGSAEFGRKNGKKGQEHGDERN